MQLIIKKTLSNKLIEINNTEKKLIKRIQSGFHHRLN